MTNSLRDSTLIEGKMGETTRSRLAMRSSGMSLSSYNQDELTRATEQRGKAFINPEIKA